MRQVRTIRISSKGNTMPVSFIDTCLSKGVSVGASVRIDIAVTLSPMSKISHHN